MNENKMSVGAFFQKYTMIIALVLVVVFFAIATGGKNLLPGNINNLIAQNGYVFVLAAGMLLCILTGGNIDLSVGSVVCFTAAVGCVLMDNDVNMWIAVLTMLAIGILLVLAFVFVKVRKILIQKKLNIHQSIPAQLVTTAIISGVVIWLTIKLASHKGFPTVLIWIGLVLGIYQYITTKTAIGRHLYAVGGNEKATALSGVKTRNVYWFAYASIGLMAGLAGILTAARAKGIDPTYGEGYEMDAIASCFIGGASAYGGVGKVSGMIIGAVLMGVINQGMNIVGVDSNFQKVVKGLVLLLAVVFDVLSKRQKR